MPCGNGASRPPGVWVPRSTCSSRSRWSSSFGNPAHDHILCSRLAGFRRARDWHGPRAGARRSRRAPALRCSSRSAVPKWQRTTSCPNRNPHPTHTRSRTTCPTACSKSLRLIHRGAPAIAIAGALALVAIVVLGIASLRSTTSTATGHQAATVATPLQLLELGHTQSGAGLDGRRTRAESARRPTCLRTSPPRCSCSTRTDRS